MSTAPPGPGGGPPVGVDVGGTKMLGVALDAAGEVVASRKVPTPDTAHDVIAALAALVAEVAGGRPGSVGVGLPGMVAAPGVLTYSPHVPWLVGVPVGAQLTARLGGPAVAVTNDASAAGWAEHRRGAAVGVDDVLMVTLGTGIGGGIVTGGRLVTGAHGYAGEIGHMIVVPQGPPCPCGQRGCWERFASGSGLARLGRERAVAGRAPGVVAAAGGDPEAIQGEHVTVAAAAGDPDAVALMAELGWWVALGLANLANILDPAAVVLGGGLISAGEVLMGPARNAFAQLIEGYHTRSRLALVPAALGETAGAIGAALIGSGSGVGHADMPTGTA